MMIPISHSFSGAYLRQTTSMLQGLCRDTYSRTAMSGNSHRIVFDLEAQTYWVERTEGGAVVKRQKIELTQEGAATLVIVDERLDGTEDSDDAEDQEKRRLYEPPSWEAVEGEEGRPTKLHPDIRFHSVWVDHLEDRARKGQAALHFFPGGFTQEAQVTFTDDDRGERTLTLSTNPLTGETYIDTEIPDLPSY